MAHGVALLHPLTILPLPQTLPEVVSRRSPCFAFQRGKCPSGNNCPFEHVKADAVGHPRNLPKEHVAVVLGVERGEAKARIKNGKNCLLAPQSRLMAKGDKDGRQHDEKLSQRRKKQLNKGWYG